MEIPGVSNVNWPQGPLNFKSDLMKLLALEDKSPPAEATETKALYDNLKSTGNISINKILGKLHQLHDLSSNPIFTKSPDQMSIDEMTQYAEANRARMEAHADILQDIGRL